ncbi:hypothetical protein HA466_0137330 [Hirschfeldia incana]|nr:hypothetical protein HA466_0137330 [Hirschfeldia incana]
MMQQQLELLSVFSLAHYLSLWDEAASRLILRLLEVTCTSTPYQQHSLTLAPISLKSVSSQGAWEAHHLMFMTGKICGHWVYEVSKSEIISLRNSSLLCNIARSENRKGAVLITTIIEDIDLKIIEEQ